MSLTVMSYLLLGRDKYGFKGNNDVVDALFGFDPPDLVPEGGLMSRNHVTRR